jgi:aminoglycoside phosphotransferase (APT) family kinase protein
MSDEDQSAKPKTSTRDRDDIAGRLAEWLRGVTGADEMPVVGGLDVPDKGGLSSDTLLADLSWTAGGQRHDRRVAVRLPPPADAWPVFPAYDLARQAAAMEAVRRGTSVPVPEVLWYEPDAAPLGDPFFVMDRVDGVAAPDYLPYTWGSWVTELTRGQRAVVADTCIDVLAAIHGAEVTPEIADALELRAFDGSPLRRHFESERARYDWARDDRHFPTIERGFEVLEAHWPAHERDARIGWGDARLGNILFSGTEPVAVLDWEMVALTPPELDLSWMVFFAEYFQRSAERRTLPGIPDFLTRETAVARYERVTDTSVEHFDWYLCYTAVREAIVSLRTMGRAVHFGELAAPEDPEALILDRDFVIELTDALERS